MKAPRKYLYKSTVRCETAPSYHATRWDPPGQRANPSVQSAIRASSKVRVPIGYAWKRAGHAEAGGSGGDVPAAITKKASEGRAGMLSERARAANQRPAHRSNWIESIESVNLNGASRLGAISPARKSPSSATPSSRFLNPVPLHLIQLSSVPADCRNQDNSNSLQRMS